MLAALTVACVTGLFCLSVARAYLSAEGLWTKATLTALLQVERLVESGDPESRRLVDAALQVPLHMRLAREALDNRKLELAVPAQHFIDAGVAPSDASPMCWIYRLASGTSWAQTTIDRWRQGDDLVDAVRTLVSSVPPRADRLNQDPRIQPLREEAHRLTDRFVAGQGVFAQRVSDRSRWYAQLSIVGTVLLAATLTLAAARHERRRRTREVAARAALEAAHERLSLALQSDHLGTFEWCVGSESVLLDERACELYNVKSTGAMTSVDRSQLRPHVHPDDQVGLRRAMDAQTRQRSMFKYRYRVVAPDTGYRHVEITGICSTAPGGLLMVGVVRDISQEVLSGQAQSDARALQVATATRSRLLSRLSHELRTPLNVILGFAQVLGAESPSMTERQAAWIKEIETAAKGLLRMIDDVLRITAIAAGAHPVGLQTVDLARAVSKALARHAQICGARKVHVEQTGASPGLLVSADPERLAEALDRLLEHICNVAAEGSVLRVQCEPLQDHIEATLSVSRWVTPAAVGTSLLDQPPSAHLGFGLALVEALMEQMGGAFDVLGQPAGATRVVLRLARSEPS